MFADPPVADTRCYPAGAPEQEHNSEVSLPEIARLFTQADYAWARAAGGSGLEKRLRRQRHAAAKAMLASLRHQALRRLNAWRTVAAAEQDYSGPDPALEMIRLMTGIKALEWLAWWQIAHGWPAPSIARPLALCDRPVLRRPASAAV